MKPFQYLRPKTIREAVQMAVTEPAARFIAGGTNLIDLMKRGIEMPDKLIDINHLPLKKISYQNKTLRIGALVLNSEVAAHQTVLQRHPLLAQALNAGASGQIRNMATVGGNLLQRTRCSYFYDTAMPCNKRRPNSGCGAREGINRMHAILGIGESPACIAVHPSDMCVALAALDATVVVANAQGERKIPMRTFHRLASERPDVDTELLPGDLVVAVEIPDHHFGKHYHYLKVRDRASYAFALVSVAAGLQIENGRINRAAVALGGVAHRPWGLSGLDNVLAGQPPSEAIFQQYALQALQDAKAGEHNAYKIRLATHAIVGALKTAAGIS